MSDTEVGGQPKNNKNPVSRKERDSRPSPPPPRFSYPLWVVLVSLLLYFFLHKNHNEYKEIPYSLFKQQVGLENVQSIITQGKNVSGVFKTALPSVSGEKEILKFRTYLLAIDDVDLIRDLEVNKVEVNSLSSEESTWQQILLSVIPCELRLRV
ncbi:MAG TPA: ATP-dependent metallopeptidase FtsH/Yme1/Tma family protein [Pseudomonadales bacterium]|nr:ATP-dependent metallopeptidase FtsH/Yme1/Tma family protein [Pseudomonadales bacterium]